MGLESRRGSWYPGSTVAAVTSPLSFGAKVVSFMLNYLLLLLPLFRAAASSFCFYSFSLLLDRPACETCRRGGKKLLYFKKEGSRLSHACSAESHLTFFPHQRLTMRRCFHRFFLHKIYFFFLSLFSSHFSLAAAVLKLMRLSHGNKNFNSDVSVWAFACCLLKIFYNFLV